MRIRREIIAQLGTGQFAKCNHAVSLHPKVFNQQKGISTHGASLRMRNVKRTRMKSLKIDGRLERSVGMDCLARGNICDRVIPMMYNIRITTPLPQSNSVIGVMDFQVHISSAYKSSFST